jgi:hypothetical protein
MKRRKRKTRAKRAAAAAAAGDEASYVCPSCGESIVIPIDPSGGAEQQYVEDCPVCCNPNVIHVELFDAGEPARVWAEAE